MSVPAHSQAIERLERFVEKRMAEATHSGRGHMGGLNRIYRIEEDLSHARLTLHAASALKTQSRQGRGIEDYLLPSVQRARKKGGDLWMRMPGSQRDPAGRDQEKDGLESFSGSGNT